MTTPKKVLIFSLSYYPMPVSGAEAAIDEITRRIDPQDIEFHLICIGYDRRAPRVEQLRNVHVHRIGFSKPDPTFPELRQWPLHVNKYYYQIFAPLKALWLHRTHRFDAVWCLMPHSAGVPSSIFKLLVPKVKLITTLQEGDPIEHIEKSVRPLWPLFIRAFTKADVIQAISQYLADWAKKYRVTAPVHLIHNAGNPEDFKTDNIPEVTLTALKESLGKQLGDVWLVNTARLVPQKAHAIVIKALVHLPPHVKFLIVGGGPEEEMLQRLAVEEGVTDRVIMTGAVDRSEVTKYRRIADIFVMPSRSEGLGNAGLSAMASRLPFVTTGVGGLAEYAFSADTTSPYGQTAWLVPVDDPAALAKTITEIMHDDATVARVCENARRMVDAEYHWDSIAAQMKTKVFDYVLKASV